MALPEIGFITREYFTLPREKMGGISFFLSSGFLADNKDYAGSEN
jgi:hypothetical protein